MSYWFVIELVVTLTVTAGGSLVVAATGVRGWATPFLGIAVGMALLVLIGSAQVLFRLPISVPVTLILVSFLPALLLAWVPADDRLWVGLTVAVGTAAVTALAAAGLEVFDRFTYIKHVDTMEYLAIGSMIFNDTFEEGVSTYQLQKRMFAVPFLHFSANWADEYYLRTIGPLAALSTCGSLAWLAVSGLRDRNVLSPPLLAALAVAALLAMNRFWMHTLYINSHLIVALWVLLLAGSGWLLAVRTDLPSKALWSLQAASVVGLVLARPEGFLLAGIGLLPTLLIAPVSAVYRAGVWLVLLLTVAGWHGYFAASFPDAAERHALEIYGPLVAAVIGLAGMPFFVVSKLETIRKWSLSLVLVMLWLALVIMALRQPGILVTSIESIAINIQSYWGYAFLLIAMLSLVCTVYGDFAGRRLLSFPILSFICLLFLLAYLRGEPYRVGGGDSGNRIMMHIVPLMILAIVASAGARWTLPRIRVCGGGQ